MSLYFLSNKKLKRIKNIQKRFLSNGYVIFDIDKSKLLKVVNFVQSYLKKKKINKNLDLTHKQIYIKNLNSLRMDLNFKINSTNWFSNYYFNLAKDEIVALCGNDLVMQKKINLSIQFPEDNSSLLPLHSDVWTGCSPFECVLWIPLVDVYSSKSMYILKKKDNEYIYKNFNKIKIQKNFDKKILKKAKWLKLKFGQALIFNHQILHGNVVNKTEETRWSFNCRFKSIFSPYGIKEIGETFVPLTLSPMTKYGLDYEDPKI